MAAQVRRAADRAPPRNHAGLQLPRWGPNQTCGGEERAGVHDARRHCCQVENVDLPSKADASSFSLRLGYAARLATRIHLKKNLATPVSIQSDQKNAPLGWLGQKNLQNEASYSSDHLGQIGERVQINSRRAHQNHRQH